MKITIVKANGESFELMGAGKVNLTWEWPAEKGDTRHWMETDDKTEGFSFWGSGVAKQRGPFRLSQ